MPSYTGILVAVLAAVALARPQPTRVQYPFDLMGDAYPRPPDHLDDIGGGRGSSPERKAEMAELLNRWAPVFKLASTELYYPSSVEYMLERYRFVEYNNGTTFRAGQDILSVDHLSSLAHRGVNQSLSVDEECNGQPGMPTKAGEFLYGPAGQEGAMVHDSDDGRGRVHDDVYGFWVDQGHGAVDLWYWTFYPYNLGKEVGKMGWLGNHVTDWEHLRVRTVNGEAVSADFDTHSGGAFSAGTFRWIDIERTADNRPIAYVASGSHGVWPTPGKHTYAQLLNLWALVDVTDDAGAIWDTQGHVVPFEFWTGPEDAKKINHTGMGSEDWLEFKGKWGNRGKGGCWWQIFVGICQLIDGPPGPNRKFGIPPDCIMGTASPDIASYTFYLSNRTAKQAELLNVSTIVVEQVCARPRVAAASWDESLSVNDLDIWTTRPDNELPFEGATQYSVTMAPCDGSRSAAKAYRLVMKTADGEHISTSPIRVLCIYEEGRGGWIPSGAAKIDDVDEWRWNLYNEHPKPKPPKESDPINNPNQ